MNLDHCYFNVLPSYAFTWSSHTMDNSLLYYLDSKESWVMETNKCNIRIVGVGKIGVGAYYERYNKVIKGRNDELSLMFEDLDNFEKFWFHLPGESYVGLLEKLNLDKNKIEKLKKEIGFKE